MDNGECAAEFSSPLIVLRSLCCLSAIHTFSYTVQTQFYDRFRCRRDVAQAGRVRGEGHSAVAFAQPIDHVKCRVLVAVLADEKRHQIALALNPALR